MKAKPVQKINSPSYPQREQALAGEQILEKHVPPRWRRLGSVVGLLVAANLSGCAGVATESAQTKVNCRPDPVIASTGQWVKSIMEPQYVMLGCIIMTPPAYQPEDAVAPQLEGYRQTEY